MYVWLGPAVDLDSPTGTIPAVPSAVVTASGMDRRATVYRDAQPDAL